MSVLVLLLVLVLSGCARDADHSAARTWHVDSTAILSIGVVEGDPHYQLDKVRGIAELPGGMLAISNSGSGEIRVYDATGRFVRSIGRAVPASSRFCATCWPAGTRSTPTMAWPAGSPASCPRASTWAIA